MLDTNYKNRFINFRLYEKYYGRMFTKQFEILKKRFLALLHVDLYKNLKV